MRGVRLTLTIVQMLVRITGILLLILGLLIWTENMTNLIQIHMLLGVILVLSLLVLAVVTYRAGVPLGMAIGLAVLAVVVLVLGMTQMSLLPRPDPNHWIVQVVHLLLGMAAIGMAEAIGGRLRRTRSAPAHP
jgi:FtsH-binding integral membrane protein